MRQYIAEKLLEKKSEWIDSLPDREKQKIFKIAALCYIVGSVQENEADGNFEVVKKLEEVDAFFKYFGYLVANLPPKRGHLSVGFAVPAIEEVTVTKDLIDKFGLSYVRPEEVEMRSINIVGNYVVEIPYPLVDVETYRVSAKLDKIEKVGSLLELDTEEVREIIRSYVGGSKKGGKEKNKEDFMNILFAEVLAPSYDLVQKIVFLDDDVEMHKGIFAGMKSLFRAEPFIGGRVSAGYGLIDDVVIVDSEGQVLEPTEADFERFVDRVDLEKVKELLNPVKKGK